MSEYIATLEELLTNFCALCVRLNPQHKGCLACIEMNGYRDAVKGVKARIEEMQTELLRLPKPSDDQGDGPQERMDAVLARIEALEKESDEYARLWHRDAAHVKALKMALQTVHEWFNKEDGFKWPSEMLADDAWHVSLVIDAALREAKEEKP